MLLTLSTLFLAIYARLLDFFRGLPTLAVSIRLSFLLYTLWPRSAFDGSLGWLGLLETLRDFGNFFSERSFTIPTFID